MDVSAGSAEVVLCENAEAGELCRLLDDFHIKMKNGKTLKVGAELAAAQATKDGFVPEWPKAAVTGDAQKTLRLSKNKQVRFQNIINADSLKRFHSSSSRFSMKFQINFTENHNFGCDFDDFSKFF